jgi:3-dehydroquinate synthase
MHKHDSIYAGESTHKMFEEFLKEAERIYSSVFLLVDTNTRLHCLPYLAGRFRLPKSMVILEAEPGEKSKNIETCSRLWYEMARLGADRHSLLICLGGGVTCDLGGFVASTYQRGISFIFLPTSLLAQVDAAIGGKTGVNLKNLKNYIGLFSPPDAIFIFTEFLKSLPGTELLSGYAEVVKHALLSNEKTFRQLSKKFPDSSSITEVSDWSLVVQRSVKIKNNVVSKDPFEKGLRKVLNLGHTVGHAFESHALKNNPQGLHHGFAVAMGLVVELNMSVQACGFPEELANEIISYILSVFPFYSFEANEIPEIAALMGFDKKNKSGNIRITMLRQPGDLITDVACSTESLEIALATYLELGSAKGIKKLTAK